MEDLKTLMSSGDWLNPLIHCPHSGLEWLRVLPTPAGQEGTSEEPFTAWLEARGEGGGVSTGCRGRERGNGSGLTSFRSFRLVSITMVAAFCSQTMRQKSLTVSCLGPGDRGQGPIDMDGGSSRDLTQPCRPPVPSPPAPGPCDYPIPWPRADEGVGAV